MESIKIEQLLEKYENAETSLHEEAVLKDYFNNNDVAPHLQQYQALFGYYAESKNENYSKPIRLNTKKQHWKWLSVAASVVLLFSVYTGYTNNQEKKEAKIAFENTQMAFQLLSKNMKKGTTAMAYLGEYETTTNKIFKNNK